MASSQAPVAPLYKNIIISGGARGIGRALTRMMLEAGHHAYVFDIDEEELDHTCKVHLQQYYADGRLGYAICDLRNVNEIRAKVKEAASFFNDRIDVLINNGGIASPQWKDGKTMEDPSTIDEWQAYIDTNLTAPFAMSQACVPYMKARASDVEEGAHMQNANNSSPAGPCIIHIGSFRAHQSDPNQEGYASSKSGLIGLMHSMAISLGHLGIRVNLIAPGRIKVAHESKEGDEKGTDWASQISEKDISDHPTNRAGRPKDIADAALYLIEAGFVTDLRENSKNMSCSVEIITTPTADSPGTALVLRTATKHYVFGSMAEGTQRAMVQQGTRLLKAQDFFLTGRAEWKNMGGLIGMMLTLADASTSSYTTSMETFRLAQERGRKAEIPSKPHFDVYGPPNLKHTLGTCRRFIFRKGIPIVATEYTNQSPAKDENGVIIPTWQDSNINVWAMSVSPAGSQPDAQAEAEIEERRRHFDTHLNTFKDFQAPENETPEAREVRYDKIRTATIKFMFDSNWSFDTLVEQHISEVKMPAAMFVRTPKTHSYEPYNGPKPGGSEPLPDITVWTRTPWPGAQILALPPTKPVSECVSYIVRAHPTRGQFDVARAKELGITPGPQFGQLSKGISVQNANGEWVTPEQVMGADRPGQGIAILDVPSVDYVDSLVQREELNSPEVMKGIGAIVWMLGPGVAGHPTLTEFMKKLSDVEHVISSIDTAPNRMTNDSVAIQATRLGQVDPARYSTPVFDNTSVPQKSIYRAGQSASSELPKGVIAADRGLTFALMPRFTMKKDSISRPFDDEAARRDTAPEVLELAQEAQKVVQSNREDMNKWRQLLARPDTEVITLGTGSALPSKYRNVSATLVRVPGIGNYLFDCGENTLGQLARVFPHEELIDVLKNLRVIWISHLHADHHLGTAAVIRAWYQVVHNSVPNLQPLGTTVGGIDISAYGLSVISHNGMLQWLHEYSAIEDFGYSRILPLQITANEQGSSSRLSIMNSFGKEKPKNPEVHRSLYEKFFGFEDIQTANVAHCHGSMAVSITFPRSPSDPKAVEPLKVSYSGDCRPSFHFSKIGTNTTVLIHEATFDDALLGDAKAKKHSTTSEALGIGAKMNAKAVVLTHFSQRYQKIPVLQTVTDGEQEDPLLEPSKTTEDPAENDDEVDPTLDNADNMDIHPTIAPPSRDTAKPIPTLQCQSSSLAKMEQVVKIRNNDLKVAIAFDYMRVRIGDICELQYFTDALNTLLLKEAEAEGETVDGEASEGKGSGKRASESDGEGQKRNKKKICTSSDSCLLSFLTLIVPSPSSSSSPSSKDNPSN
ncbi:hypothetical protein COCSADRAFT_176435 [Bipolaris sorokiniana ND90Pr]|uniref:ribonuclease Z n=1 Tax=Cochliobolus sativus (strain ND90Pr / ATCC 201652) TaxID=665912 RepID=M2S809_COCSN|nr:uncharacterized protein COCSADRAFT_176435 [Bipolaris sorokiniana ND90Pr]EMD58620.1 hypothetical protein COCSADRAFT_176435 [Bipolaris sorokiniana ND90Pr]